MCAHPRRKDGGLKQSGLCQGDHRVGCTLRFKLQVVDEYRLIDSSLRRPPSCKSRLGHH